MHVELGAYQITAMNQTVENLPAQVEHVALGSGHVLWVSDGLHLFSIDIETRSVKDYGQEWVVSGHLPAKVTEINALGEDRASLARITALYH